MFSTTTDASVHRQTTSTTDFIHSLYVIVVFVPERDTKKKRKTFKSLCGVWGEPRLSLKTANCCDNTNEIVLIVFALKLPRYKTKKLAARMRSRNVLVLNGTFTIRPECEALYNINFYVLSACNSTAREREHAKGIERAPQCGCVSDGIFTSQLQAEHGTSMDI